jgi:hypothetical protein
MDVTFDYSDPAAYVIQIARDSLTLIQASPVEIRQFNIDDFRWVLMDLQDNDDNIWAPTTHRHTPPFTISGVTLARVLEILEPYWLEFEDGQYNVNIVGGNSNVSDRTIKNSVGLNTANSAGLQDPFALQAAAFGGFVSLDPNATQTGTTFPYGTRSFPVTNVVDAIAICKARGLRSILILADFTLTSGDFSDGYNFEADNSTTQLTLEAAADVTNCEFRNMTITGDLDNGNTLRNCSIGDLNYFNGYIFQCGFTGTVTLMGVFPATIMQCFSLVADNGDPDLYPKIDLQGTQVTPLIVRDWQGSLRISNCSDQQAAVSIDMSSGPCYFDDTITDGTYTVRGISAVTDDSGVGATVNDYTITSVANEIADTVRPLPSLY